MSQLKNLSFESMLYSVVVPQYKRAAQCLAKMIYLAATLTKEELKKMIYDLEKMLYEEGFESKDGLFSLKKPLKIFHGYNFGNAETIEQVFKIIERLISTTGKVGDEEMQFLEKSLKEIPDLKASFKNLEFDVAKEKVLRVLESLDELIDKLPEKMKRKTLSPKEFEEMKKLKVV